MFTTGEDIARYAMPSSRGWKNGGQISRQICQQKIKNVLRHATDPHAL